MQLSVDPQGARRLGDGPGPAGKFLCGVPQSPEEALILVLMQAGRRLKTRHPEDEVDPSTFPLARQLMEHDTMRVSDLAARVGLDASTVSRQIKQLEDKGIIERTVDPGDRRASLVQLTSEGRSTMQSAFRRRFERIKKVLTPWSDSDRADLQRLLTRLAHDLGEANDSAANADDTQVSTPASNLSPHSSERQAPPRDRHSDS